MRIVETNEDLAGFLGELAGAPYLALDTEFLRDQTYYPKLCLIQVAAPGVEGIIDPLAPGLDLTPTQYGLLFLLVVMPADHADTARLVGVERSTGDRLLARLKARGYVEMSADSGRRVLQLTPAGWDVFRTVRRLADESDETQLACLAPPERARLLDSLARLVFFHQG